MGAASLFAKSGQAKPPRSVTDRHWSAGAKAWTTYNFK